MKSTSNIDKIGGINNYNKLDSMSNPHEFEMANKIGYTKARPNTHSGMIQTFSNNNNINVNTGVNNMVRNNNAGREQRINTMRNNNMKRAKTPIMNKITARNFNLLEGVKTGVERT